MNKINTRHALKFIKSRLEKHEQHLTEEQAKYETAKLVYELKQQKSLFWKVLRKLGIKPTEFKRSSEGCLDWLYCSCKWDSYLLAYNRVLRFKNYLQVLEYHDKMQHQDFTWTFDLDIQLFYKYCQENKIPY